MKKLKIAAGAFIVWQVATLFYKDESFRKRFNEVDGFEKAKVLFNNLLDLNKKIFFDIKEYDYQWKSNEIRQMINIEISRAEEKLNELKNSADKINKEKVQPIIEDLEDKSEYIKNSISESYNDLNEKYDLETKYEQLKEKVNELRKKIK